MSVFIFQVGVVDHDRDGPGKGMQGEASLGVHKYASFIHHSFSDSYVLTAKVGCLCCVRPVPLKPERLKKTHPQVDSAAPATAAMVIDATNGSGVVALEEYDELDDGLTEGPVDEVTVTVEVEVARGDSVGTDVLLAFDVTVSAGAEEKVLLAVDVAVADGDDVDVAVAVADDELLEDAVLLEVAVKVKMMVQGSHCGGNTLMTISP
jgi:hypothetical protein